MGDVYKKVDPNLDYHRKNGSIKLATDKKKAEKIELARKQGQELLKRKTK